MIKIYVPNVSNTSIGGGFSFIRNFRKGLSGKVEFVDNWKDCDIVFVFGITTIDKAEIHEAINNGKKLVLRVDNIPRKSRNRRQSPAERLTEFGGKASAVVYQSNWCKEFAGYFIKNDNEHLINNGVDKEIFNYNGESKENGLRYLYINYNDNPNKRFDEAIYRFEMTWRHNKKSTLTIAGNTPKIYIQHPEYNFDLNVPAEVKYIGICETPEQTAKLMQEHDILIYPSFAEAYPNTILEALACGMKVKYVNILGGSYEAIQNSFKGIKTIQEMGDEYLEVFKEITK